MALGQSLDYTDKDEDAIRARLTNLLAGVFPDWTDHNRANFGNVLLWLFSFVGGILTFYQDNQAGESRITTARQRRSLLALAKLLGYRAPGATAATTDLTVTLAAVPVGDVTLVAGDTFRTREVTAPVVFQLLADVTIPAGASPPQATATVEHSASVSETAQSTGAANQEFKLASRPFLDGSLLIAAEAAYTVVESFLSSTASDRHATVTVDQNDRATVRFGNGANGKIPTGTITFSYRVGGGTGGNVEANTVTRVDRSYTDAFGNPVIVSCANASAASGGADRATVEQIREAAPLSIRAISRTVSREDYEINARRDARVARALMLTSNEAPVPENQGRLFIVPVGGGTPSAGLLDDVEELVTVTYPNTLTFRVWVQAAVYKTVSVSTTVHFSAGQTPAVVRARILSALQNYFALTLSDGSANLKVNFGYYYTAADGSPASEVPFSDIYNAVRDTEGVRKVADTGQGLLLNGEDEDVSLALQEFPVLGTVTVIDGDTGLPV